jgi:hypothetical protein
MTTQRLVTTRDVGAEISRLISESQGESEGSIASRVAGRRGPLIAKLRSTIADGDYGLKDATLMTFASGALAETGYTVRVRHVGTGTVAAGTICFPEPCGNLGQCFTRYSSPLTSVNIQWTRSQTVVEPLNSNTDVAGYTRAWTFGLPYVLETLVAFSNAPIWHLKGRTGISEDPTAGTPANPRFIAKMAPIRFRIGDTGWSNFTPKRTRQLLAQGSGSGETAFSNLSPPEDGHAGAAIVTSVTITPPLGTLYNSSQSGVKFVRMLVNGADVSGILSVNALANQYNGYGVYACRAATITISPTVITDDDVVEFDYWYLFSVTRSEGFYATGDNGIDGGPIPVVGAATESKDLQYPQLQFRALFNSINVQSKRTAGDKYKLTFAGNPVGGASELTMESQTGWLFEQLSATMIRMSKTTGTGSGERVTFNWGREIAEIIVSRMGTMPPGSSPFMRFLPAASGDYGQIDGASTPGVWDPQGTTTFSVRAVMALTGLGGVGYCDSSRYPSNYFTGFPTAITVEKV